jgi:23S rRNA (adenine2503-C2)-methyltransferase
LTAGGNDGKRDRVKTLIHGLSQAEVTDWCLAAGEKAYRASQLWNWLYVKRVPSWDEMKNLSVAFRERLAETFEIEPAKVLTVEGQAPETRKILVGLRDGDCVEEVLIPARERRTLCVSSQVGCRFACAFCASGQGGFARNLEPGEIVGQVLLGSREYGDRPTNIVYMGMGEPFDNYEAVLKSIRIINDGQGINIGARHITISTSGVIPGIERMAGEGFQVELSVSLHAPDDVLRDRLMPVNRKYPIAKLMEACARYVAATKRIITFEYTLIRGVNDSREQANALAKLARQLPSKINLIPLSPVDGFEGLPPAEGTIEMFIDVLAKAGVTSMVRASKGVNISAACGQLRRRRVG